MPTTWYFDGAGTSADCRIMVLSGLGASEEVWKAFDDAWSAALVEVRIKDVALHRLFQMAQPRPSAWSFPTLCPRLSGCSWISV